MYKYQSHNLKLIKNYERAPQEIGEIPEVCCIIPTTIAGSSASEPSPICPSVTVIPYKMLYVECWQAIRTQPPLLLMNFHFALHS